VPHRVELSLAVAAVGVHASFVTEDTAWLRRRLHKRGSYMPPVRWYADTALAVGLRRAAPHRLRFFIAADDSAAAEEFKVRRKRLSRRSQQSQRVDITSVSLADARNLGTSTS